MKKNRIALLLAICLFGCQKTIQNGSNASGEYDTAAYLRLIGLKQIPKVLEVLARIDHTATPAKVEIVSVRRVESLSPLVDETPLPAKHTLVAVSAQGERLSSTPIHFTTVKVCDGPPTGETTGTATPPVQAKTEQVLLTIVDDANIRQLEIIDEQGNPRATFAMTKAETGTEPVSFRAVLDPQTASDGQRTAVGPDGKSRFYHVVILGHNFPSTAAFHQRATASIQNLFTYPVYQRNKPRIQFFMENRTGSLGCRHGLGDLDNPDPRLRYPTRVIFCNEDQIIARANAAGLYDHIAVLSYDPERGGATYSTQRGVALGTPKGSYFAMSTEYPAEEGDYRQAFAHEIGHLFGLHDEYSIANYFGQNDGPNCVTSIPTNRAGWQGYEPKRGCSSPIWFRPDDSIMKNSNLRHYNKPSEIQIENVIRRAAPEGATLQGFMNWTNVDGDFVGRRPMGNATFSLQSNRTFEICLECERRVDGDKEGQVSASVQTFFSNGSEATRPVVTSQNGFAKSCVTLGPSNNDAVTELKCSSDGKTNLARVNNQRVPVGATPTPTPPPNQALPEPTINLTGTMKWIIDFQNSAPNYESPVGGIANVAFSVHHGYKIKICMECRKSVDGVQQGTVYADASTKFVPIGNVAPWARQTGNGKATLCTDSIHSASRHLTTLTCSTPEGQSLSGIVDNERD